jgi:fatty-acyl-CoA synthase
VRWVVSHLTTAQNAPVSPPPFARTFIDVVREQAARAPHALALVCTQGRFTYTELAARAARVGAALRAAGVRPGDRVGLLLGNRVEWIDLCLGAAAVGAVTVPLSTWSTRRELEFLVQDAGLKLLAAQARFGERDFEADLTWLQGKPGMPAANLVWLLDTPDPRYEALLGAADAGANAVTALPPGAAASAHSDALVLYTSGSTSAPKAVPLRQHAVLENAFNIGERQGLTAADRVLLCSPLFWAFGGANALPATFTHGATLVLMEKFEAREAMLAVERERCTALYTLPAMNAALARHADYAEHGKRRLASLRTGVTIGSPEEFLFGVETLGAAELCNIYGATETCGNCCVTWHHWPLARRAHCQGPPLPGQELRFVDEETGQPAAAGEPGLAEVRGFVTAGYTGTSADQNAKAFTADGWYRTGDMGRLNADGDFVFVGRTSEMIKRAGINVSPAEVEAVIRRFPGVNDVAVVGVPDAVRGERIHAFVVAQAGVSLDTRALLRYCAAEASKYKLPDHVELLVGMPLTVTGKLQRRELKRLATERLAALAADAVR